jgi:hypothetical protein
MIMRVAASKAGRSSPLASVHLWNASCSVLSQVPLQRNRGPFYTDKSRAVVLSNKQFLNSTTDCD